ncbi:hypothetical protein B0O99DRAFT_351274 [Bisporella sp. PMI_857]|nr:hypothetical protein B0O99DRAFT_351274 [Bisporella sp. PMI_857]
MKIISSGTTPYIRYYGYPKSISPKRSKRTRFIGSIRLASSSKPSPPNIRSCSFCFCITSMSAQALVIAFSSPSQTFSSAVRARASQGTRYSSKVCCSISELSGGKWIVELWESAIACLILLYVREVCAKVRRFLEPGLSRRLFRRLYGLSAMLGMIMLEVPPNSIFLGGAQFQADVGGFREPSRSRRIRQAGRVYLIGSSINGLTGLYRNFKL